MSERLTALLQRRARLDEAIATVRRAESEARRRDDTRRKVVVGGALLALARRDPAARSWLHATLTTCLSERDRGLFATGDEAVGDIVLVPITAASLGPTESTQGGGWDEHHA